MINPIANLIFKAKLHIHSNSTDINRFERQVYSQYGEDGVIEYIFHKIGSTNRFAVELGAGDGSECNTRYLKQKGWHTLQIDTRKGPDIKSHFITKKNVEALLKKYRVPKQFDLLSIDIDGNDYWTWKQITRFQPRVVIIEYNAAIKPPKSLTIPYDSNFNWDGTTYYGASLSALNKLAQKKGYLLIGTTKNGINAFFVHRQQAKKVFPPKKVAELYHPANYNPNTNRQRISHPTSPKMNQMISV